MNYNGERYRGKKINSWASDGGYHYWIDEEGDCWKSYPESPDKSYRCAAPNRYVAYLSDGIGELKTALVQCAVPLEALLASECDDEATALSENMKDEICNAVVHLRIALSLTPPKEEE